LRLYWLKIGPEHWCNFVEKVNTNFFAFWKNIENWVHGFLQNYARPKKVCKKTSETSAGQSSPGGFKLHAQ
jgi:hypothetical protein